MIIHVGCSGCFYWHWRGIFYPQEGPTQEWFKHYAATWRNVVEFRHKSWWRKSVYRALAAHGITFCAVSGPRLPEDLPETGGAKRRRPERLYVRFHGRTRWYRHDYSGEELAAWARRIVLSRAKEVWVYFNNDREGFALKNALELRDLLRELVGEEDE
jgi:uncharacterized protein YecE (DUF72 family)